MGSETKGRMMMSDSEVLGEVDLMHKFVCGEDNIKREEIRNFAKDLARKYKERQASALERVVLVVGELSDNRLNELLPEEIDKPRTKKGREGNELIEVAGSSEGLGALENLRKAVLYELSGEIEPTDFWMITANILAGASIKNFISGYGGKEAFLRQHVFSDNQNAIRPHAEAIERYAALPESPHLMPIKNYELYRDDDQVAVVVPEKDFFSLKQLIEVVNLETREYTPQISFVDFLTAILGAAKGIKILKDNGLMLTDICLDNIGWDKRQKNGSLFDLDSLYRVGSKVGRVSHQDYFTPEEEAGVPTLADSEMVFQLGVSLGGFIVPYIKFLPRDLSKRVLQFSQRLIVKDSDVRPTVEEVIVGLEEIIVDLDDKQLQLL